MTMQIREEHGVEYREEELPADHVVVDEYTPHTTPWDCYGEQHLRELSFVLTAAGIPNIGLRLHRRNLVPRGSGPGGRVRFGDDMLASTYRIAVPAALVEVARAALQAHRQDVTDWLDYKRPCPAAVQHGRW